MTSEAQPGGWELSVEDRDQLAGRVFALVLEQQLQEFCSHEPGVVAGEDPEELHDYRVALRHTRSLLVAGTSVYPAEELELLSALAARFAEPTSVLRDLDVLVDDFEDRVETIVPELRDGAPELLDELCARRAAAHAGLVAEIEGDLHATLLRRWQVMSTVYRIGGSGPGPDAMARSGSVVDRIIAEAAADLRRVGSKASGKGEPARWHKVRKRLKRLRYLIAIFAPMYDEGTFDRSLRRMSKLQNRLGSLQDDVAQTELLSDAGAAVGGRAGLCAGAMCEVALRSEPERVQRCDKAWKKFDSSSTWSRIEDAVGS